MWLSRCPGREGGRLAVLDVSREGGAHTHVLRVENPGQWAEEACSRTHGRGEPTGPRKGASGGREGGVATAQGREVFRKEHQNRQYFTAVRTRQVGRELHPAALGQGGGGGLAEQEQDGLPFNVTPKIQAMRLVN